MTGQSRLAKSRRRFADERGSATLSLAVVFPVVLLLIFTAVQAALYFYARNAAHTAAEEGLRVAQAEDGTSSAGIARAQDLIQRTDALDGPAVSSTRGQGTTTVTVAGAVPSVLPGFQLSVTQTATGPTERVTTP
jgi:Flp pilus assembly protein TadG